MWSTKYPHTLIIYCKVDMYKIDGHLTRHTWNKECWNALKLEGFMFEYNQQSWWAFIV
jgi:hypothetical protein